MVTIRDVKTIFKIIKNVHVKNPRQLPIAGTGGLHIEQQCCFEKGYKEGMIETKRAIERALLDADAWEQAENKIKKRKELKERKPIVEWDGFP